MYDPEVPTATEAYGYAWSPLWSRFPELLLAALLWTVIAAPGGILHKIGAVPLAFAYHTLVTVPLTFGALYVYLRAARGEAIRPAHLFEAFRSCYVQTIFAHVLFVTLVGMGLVLLVVPGLFIATRLAFVGFLVVDEAMDAPTAVRESWRRTEGIAGRIFLVWLLGIPLGVAGLALFGVGFVPAVMWIHLAFAVLFVAATDGMEALADGLRGSLRAEPGPAADRAQS
ncbi:MAG TPA: hypothetical protein VMS22_13910 [Candidatus Eisenbacteria bacterium]|nr:hypothetical protein [Candidatus Eisenbacteria bacterium]